MATLYKSNGETIEVEPKDGKHFQLRELYQMLDCELIEVIFLRDGRLMIIDEEGKYTKSDINPKATRVFLSSRRLNDDFIVGDALVCSSEQFN
ncbi:MAG: DUF3846 domain-containing protein [Bacteroidales bacterium]|nr:DUF3846 domain-containing protein [Bacteroidales bacterium]